MQFHIRTTGVGFTLAPTSGAFQGRVIATVERYICFGSQKPDTDHPSTLRAVWGLVPSSDKIFEDPEVIGSLGLTPRVRRR